MDDTGTKEKSCTPITTTHLVTTTIEPPTVNTASDATILTSPHSPTRLAVLESTAAIAAAQDAGERNAGTCALR
ncbi:MAG: hypothetical protein M3143_14645, partial [Actinomycetota bacterium]|nr:hypothetical protein [Actinomycetota bacterium]